MQIYSDAIGHCQDAPQASDTTPLNRNGAAETVRAETAATLSKKVVQSWPEYTWNAMTKMEDFYVTELYH